MKHTLAPAVLQGSVRRDAGFVRVTARLLDETGFQVWSEIYDRELESIFLRLVQGDVGSGKTVVAALAALSTLLAVGPAAVGRLAGGTAVSILLTAADGLYAFAAADGDELREVRNVRVSTLWEGEDRYHATVNAVFDVPLDSAGKQ